MNAAQESNKSNIVCESPQLELSVGIGRPWFDKGSIKKDKCGREKLLDLEKVKPWVGTPRELHAFLNSHRYASTNKSFKHKVGHFIVGAVFAGTEEHPAGHRHSDSLQRATLVLFDIDNAPDLTRTELEARLHSLGVGFIFYSTWSNARAGSGKTGLCARIIFWLTRPLTAPNGLPQTLRVQSIGQQLAAIVRHVSTCLEIDSTKAVDEVSKRPHQLMYTPRGHDARRNGPDCWWCEFHDGSALNPDSLPGGVSLADLLPPNAPQLTNPSEASATPTPLHPPSKAALQTRKGSDDMLRARALAYLTTCAKDFNTLGEGSGRYTRISSIAPYLGSIAKGHGLTKSEGLTIFNEALNGWGDKDLTRGFNSMFTYGYHNESRTLPTNNPPRSPPKLIPPADTSGAVSSPSNDAEPDAEHLHHETVPVAPQHSLPFVKGNPTFGTCLALPRRFDLWRQDPPEQRPHLVCVKSIEDIDTIAAKIPDGKRVIVGIPKTHSLYSHAINTFLAKGCDVHRT